MRIKNKGLLARLAVLVAVLIATVLLLSGCLGGTRLLGWSGAAISGDSVFFGSMDGRLIAYFLENGNPKWQAPLQSGSVGGTGGCAGPSAAVGIYGTPVIYEDAVFVTAYTGNVYALVAETGQPRWTFPGDGFLSPVIGGVAVAGGVVFFGTSDGEIYALDTATGDQLWKTSVGDKIWATPVIDDGILYIGSFDKNFYAIDTADGGILWQFTAGGGFNSTALVEGGTVYAGSLDRSLYAIDASNGSQLWRFEGGNWFASKPVLYNGVVYAANFDGSLYAIDAADGSQVAVFDLGSPAASAPVVVGGLIVAAADDGQLFVIDGETRAMNSLIDLEVRLLSPLSSDGSLVYVHTQENETLFAINPETRTIVWQRLVQ